MADTQELLKAISNKLQLKKLLRQLDEKELETVKTKFLSSIEDVHEENRERFEAQREKDRKLEEVKLQLAKEGISIEDLLEHEGIKSKSKSRTMPPKYHYRNDEGELVTWTGAGRMPVKISRAIEQGEAKLEDFLINKDS